MLDVFGVRLNLLIGLGVPVAPPMFITEALQSAEVALSDAEPSGFSLVFKLGRSNTIAGIDGIVENADMAAGEGGEGGTLTLMGRDLSALMDREERQEEYPGMSPSDIANVIIARYAQHGLVPDVRPVASADRDAPPIGARRRAWARCSGRSRWVWALKATRQA